MSNEGRRGWGGGEEEELRIELHNMVFSVAESS